MEAASSFCLLLSKVRSGCGETGHFVIPVFLRVMIRAFGRQNSTSQRQRNHGLSFEHQKSTLKTQ